jgi:mannose-6-phosphate isomerase-like protein (cupin superfamily)
MSTIVKSDQEKYRDIIVKKPWGHEYLIYENENLGIWFLHIEEDKKTSMHCHPKKNTGLICLDGSAEVSFLKNKISLKGVDKIMIFRGRFHSTQAHSPGGAYILEVECPQDKHDLVRLEDDYGRESKPYEGNEHESLKTSESLWINDPVSTEGENFNFCKCDFSIKHIQHVEELHKRPYDEVSVVLRGGLCTPSGDVIVQAGDVIAGHTLNFLSTKFLLSKNTTLLSINRA